jgi:hypothetical protein
MVWQRVSRFLPGRPGVMLILGIAAVVVFGVGFADQALTRRAMLAQYAQVQAKIAQLEEQNRLLQQGLDRAQQGELVPQKAWEYFGKTPKGTGVIVAQAPAQAEAEASADAPGRASGPGVAPVTPPAVTAVESAVASVLTFLKRVVQP